MCAGGLPNSATISLSARQLSGKFARLHPGCARITAIPCQHCALVSLARMLFSLREDLVHSADQDFRNKRLAHEALRSAMDRLRLILDPRLGCEHDNRKVVMDRRTAQLSQQRHPGHARHILIEQEQVRPPSGMEQVPSLRGIRYPTANMPSVGQGATGNLGHEFIVVGNQNVGHGIQTFAGSSASPPNQPSTNFGLIWTFGWIPRTNHDSVAPSGCRVSGWLPVSRR